VYHLHLSEKKSEGGIKFFVLSVDFSLIFLGNRNNERKSPKPAIPAGTRTLPLISFFLDVS